MEFIKRLMGRKKKTIEPVRGTSFSQSDAEQSATRKRMETEMTSDRKRRAGRLSPESNDGPPGATS